MEEVKLGVFYSAVREQVSSIGKVEEKAEDYHCICPYLSLMNSFTDSDQQGMLGIYDVISWRL